MPMQRDRMSLVAERFVRVLRQAFLTLRNFFVGHQGVEAVLDINPPERPAYVHIEREGESRYRILSSSLEHIGEQLRGKRRFSIFNSIILPVIVTIVTVLVTGSFQYISWQNTIKLQQATDRASATYDNASGEIEKRYYATLLFQVSVRNFANQKTEDKRLLNEHDIEHRTAAPEV